MAHPPSMVRDARDQHWGCVGADLQQRPELRSCRGDLQVDGFLGHRWQCKVQWFLGLLCHVAQESAGPRARGPSISIHCFHHPHRQQLPGAACGSIAPGVSELACSGAESEPLACPHEAGDDVFCAPSESVVVTLGSPLQLLMIRFHGRSMETLFSQDPLGDLCHPVRSQRKKTPDTFGTFTRLGPTFGHEPFGACFAEPFLFMILPPIRP